MYSFYTSQIECIHFIEFNECISSNTFFKYKSSSIKISQYTHNVIILYKLNATERVIGRVLEIKILQNDFSHIFHIFIPIS